MNSKPTLFPNETIVYKINEKANKQIGVISDTFFGSILIISDTLILQSIDEVNSVVPKSQNLYFY